MGKIGFRGLRFIALLLIITLLVGCSRENKSKDTFVLKDFEDAMTDKGYDYELTEAAQDIIPTTRKRMIIDDISIDIYIFENNEQMENEAGNIDDTGCSYNNGSKILKISWVSIPHFYKKGCLIVQYIGEDEKIISTLEEILGKKFAG